MKINGFKSVLDKNFIDGECMEFFENSLIKYEKLIDTVMLSSKSYRKKESGVVVDYNLEDDLVLTINPLSQFRGTLSIYISRYHNQVIVADSIHTFDDVDKGITKVTKMKSYKSGDNSIIIEQYTNYKGKNEKRIKSTALLFNRLRSLIDYKEESFTESKQNRIRYSNKQKLQSKINKTR